MYILVISHVQSIMINMVVGKGRTVAFSPDHIIQQTTAYYAAQGLSVET